MLEADRSAKPTNLFRGEDSIVNVLFNLHRRGRWFKGGKFKNVKLRVGQRPEETLVEGVKLTKWRPAATRSDPSRDRELARWRATSDTHYKQVEHDRT